MPVPGPPQTGADSSGSGIDTSPPLPPDAPAVDSVRSVARGEAVDVVEADAVAAEPAVEPRPRVAVPHWLSVWSEISVRTLLLTAGAVAVGWLFLHLSVVTIPAFIALLVTAILEPLVRRLRDRGMRPIFATWIVLGATLLLVAGVVTLLAAPVAEQFQDLGPQIEEGIVEIEDWLENGPLGLENPDLRQIAERGAERLNEDGQAGQQAVKGVTIAGEVIAGFLLALVMIFFFLKDGPLIVGWIRKHVPARRRDLADGIGRRSWATIGAYIRGTAIIGLVDGALIGIGLAVIGVPLALPISVITFFGAFFPLVGAIAAGLVAALIALVTEGPTAALLVIGLVVVIQEIEGDVLQPMVMGKALKLHPLVILVALTVGVVLAGIIGAFLAVPFAAVAVAVGIAVQEHRKVGEPSEEPAPVAP